MFVDSIPWERVILLGAGLHLLCDPHMQKWQPDWVSWILTTSCKSLWWSWYQMPDVFIKKLEMEQAFTKRKYIFFLAFVFYRTERWILLFCRPPRAEPVGQPRLKESSNIYTTATSSNWREIRELQRAYSGTRHLHPSGKSSERANFTLARANRQKWGCFCHSKLQTPPTENTPKMIISLNLHQSIVVEKKTTTGRHFPLEPVNIRPSFLEGAPTGNLFSCSAAAPTFPTAKWL